MKVLITGANRGIGLGLTREYLDRGAHVFAACRRDSEGLFLLQETHGERAVVVPLDVTNPDQIGDARDLVRQHTDSLDILINNAGVLHPSASFRDITGNALMDSLAINTLAPLRIIQYFEDLLVAGESPRIVNITGPTPPISQLPRRGNQTYMVSRYAHNALTRMVALELIDKGVITVAMWPGYVRTDMNGMDPAATPAEEALPQVVDVIAGLTPEHNGSCLLPTGEIYDW